MSGDNVDEEFVPEDEADASPAAIKRLRERAQKAEAEAKANLDGWQRARADFANYKKDEATQKAFGQERMRASLAEDIIPVLDSFEMALKHGASKDTEVLYKQLLGALKNMGVEQFAPTEGEAFDPHRHEALREVAAQRPEQDHTVVSVERSGYTLGDFIIRPAQVSVGVHAKE